MHRTRVGHNSYQQREWDSYFGVISAFFVSRSRASSARRRWLGSRSPSGNSPQLPTAGRQEPVRQVFRAGDPVNRGREASMYPPGEGDRQTRAAGHARDGLSGRDPLWRAKAGAARRPRSATYSAGASSGKRACGRHLHPGTREFSFLAAFAGRVAQEIPVDSCRDGGSLSIRSVRTSPTCSTRWHR